MRLFGRKNSYTGQECYKYTEQLLRNGRDIMIVSPYIDSYYANFLKRMHGKAKIRIISSSMDAEAWKALNNGRSFGVPLAALLVVSGSDYLLHVSGFLDPGVILISAALILLAVFSLFRKRGNIAVKKPKGFVHAKMYITENGAVHGSANLTYNGMHRNVEHIEILERGEDLQRLRGEFLRMWSAM